MTAETVATVTLPDQDPGYLDLRVLSKMFDVSQRNRIQLEGMVRSSAIELELVEPMLAEWKAVEDRLAKALRKCMRATVADEILLWQEDSKGVGEHLLARLLGVVGDPYIAYPRYWREGQPGDEAPSGEGKTPKRVLVEGDPFTRRVSDLWAYCGHGDPTRRLRRGMTQQEAMALGSPEAKMIVHLIAESCMKQMRDGVPTSDYRVAYNEARERYNKCVTCQADPESPSIAYALVMDLGDFTSLTSGERPLCPTCGGSGKRLHLTECVRCGPSGKPAQPGSEWSEKHKHTAALRKVGKIVLKDLWIVSRAAYERRESGVSDVTFAAARRPKATETAVTRKPAATSRVREVRATQRSILDIMGVTPVDEVVGAVEG